MEKKNCNIIQLRDITPDEKEVTLVQCKLCNKTFHIQAGVYIIESPLIFPPPPAFDFLPRVAFFSRGQATL